MLHTPASQHRGHSLFPFLSFKFTTVQQLNDCIHFAHALARVYSLQAFLNRMGWRKNCCTELPIRANVAGFLCQPRRYPHADSLWCLLKFCPGDLHPLKLCHPRSHAWCGCQHCCCNPAHPAWTVSKVAAAAANAWLCMKQWLRISNLYLHLQ